jgi:hypothetical protein
VGSCGTNIQLETVQFVFSARPEDCLLNKESLLFLTVLGTYLVSCCGHAVIPAVTDIAVSAVEVAS